MDPIAAEIIAGLLWFFIGNFVIGIVFWVVFVVLGGVATALNKGWIAVLGLVVAGLAYLTAIIVVWFNIISHAVALIQLLVA